MTADCGKFTSAELSLAVSRHSDSPYRTEIHCLGTPFRKAWDNLSVTFYIAHESWLRPIVYHVKCWVKSSLRFVQRPHRAHPHVRARDLLSTPYPVRDDICCE